MSLKSGHGQRVKPIIMNPRAVAPVRNYSLDHCGTVVLDRFSSRSEISIIKNFFIFSDQWSGYN